MSREGKTFIVTGGASGLGEATVRRLAQEGANVVIADVNEDRAVTIVKECGKKVIFVNTDATKEASVIACVDKAYNTFGRIDGCICCAGIGGATLTLKGKKKEDGTMDFIPHNSDVFNFLIQLNLVGVFNFNKHSAKYMALNAPDEDNLRGVIINVASVAAQDGQKGQVAYAGTKGALCAMTLPMARDLGRNGIRVMTILPGTIDTPLMMGAPNSVRDPLLAATVAPKRFGKAEEFASLAAHIIDNHFLNGECIRFDAAIRMPYVSKL